MCVRGRRVRGWFIQQSHPLSDGKLITGRRLISPMPLCLLKNARRGNALLSSLYNKACHPVCAACTSVCTQIFKKCKIYTYVSCQTHQQLIFECCLSDNTVPFITVSDCTRKRRRGMQTRIFFTCHPVFSFIFFYVCSLCKLMTDTAREYLLWCMLWKGGFGREVLFGILPAGRHEVYCTVSRVLCSMDLKEESINLQA